MLNIHITSFSYAKGVPTPPHEHGCGFVFDCRGVDNPGLLSELAPKTGLDVEIEDYLLQETKIDDFLTSIEALVAVSVDKYLERGFTDLSINFGCTGGRHRSVYSAESMGNFLRDKYQQAVNVNITHTNI